MTADNAAHNAAHCAAAAIRADFEKEADDERTCLDR